jgi:hypothetical protein
VVIDREALHLRLRRARVALRAGRPALPAGKVEVAADGRSVVAGDAPVAPAEVVGRGDVGEEAEAFDVAEVEAGLGESCGVDDQRRLAVLLLRFN